MMMVNDLVGNKNSNGPATDWQQGGHI
jgi:hypothetical protein